MERWTDGWNRWKLYTTLAYFVCRGYNKGNDKHEDADSLLHNTTIHIKCLYQFFKTLSAVVCEKSFDTNFPMQYIE